MKSIGGKKFCLCLPGAKTNQGQALCERYRQLIETLSVYCSDALTTSIGVTRMINGQDNADKILIRADKALYIAKQNGRNQVGDLNCVASIFNQNKHRDINAEDAKAQRKDRGFDCIV